MLHLPNKVLAKQCMSSCVVTQVGHEEVMRVDECIVSTLVYRAVKAPDTQRRRRSESYGYGACVCAYVNDVDDHEEGVGAYFSLVRHSDGHTKCELAGVFLLLTNGWIIRRVQCRGQACRLHAECYKSQCRGECFLLNVFMRNLSHGVLKVCRLFNLQTFCCTRGRQKVTDLLARSSRDVHLHRASNKLLVLQHLESV